jgi:hypothetical protein
MWIGYGEMGADCAYALGLCVMKGLGFAWRHHGLSFFVRRIIFFLGIRRIGM